MAFDFELILVLATLITGMIWIWDLNRRKRGSEAGERTAWWREMGRSLFPVILIVLVIRSFIVEPFRIPSGSMVPTLIAGDFILVNKFVYGLRLPALHSKIVSIDKPERGDVVVFRYPKDESQDYIKRVIGLPGDHIRYANKRLYINGELMPQDVLGRYPPQPPAELHLEHLKPVDHRIAVYPNAPARGFTADIPAGQYFMMGDNRDRSSDSRYWGTVPSENLVGEAFLIWMSWDMSDFGIHWTRLGNIIR